MQTSQQQGTKSVKYCWRAVQRHLDLFFIPKNAKDWKLSQSFAAQKKTTQPLQSRVAESFPSDTDVISHGLAEVKAVGIWL